MNMEQCHESIEKAFFRGGDIDIDMIISVSMIAEKNDSLCSCIKEVAIERILEIGNKNSDHNLMSLSLVELIKNTDWSTAKIHGHILFVALCPTPEKKGVHRPSINFANKATFEGMDKQDLPPTAQVYLNMVEYLPEATLSFHNPRWNCRTKSCGKPSLPTDDDEAEASSLLLFTFATFLCFIGVEPSIINIGWYGTKNFWKSPRE